jgi:hypothetical protein
MIFLRKKLINEFMINQNSFHFFFFFYQRFFKNSYKHFENFNLSLIHNNVINLPDPQDLLLKEKLESGNDFVDTNVVFFIFFYFFYFITPIRLLLVYLYLLVQNIKNILIYPIF